MEIYLNGALIHEYAESLKFYNHDGSKINHWFYENSEFLDTGGKPFMVTVTLYDSTEKEYKIIKCRIVRPDEPTFATFHTKKLHNEPPTKVYLNS